MRFDRVYIEIGNICNLNCDFCPKTKRAPRQMSPSEFRTVCDRIKGYSENILFHVMGEPLVHPDIEVFLIIAREYGYLVSITTNGTLLDRRADAILNHPEAIKRVSISLHAPEGNGRDAEKNNYLSSVISFAKRLAALDKNAVYRLWNLDTDEKHGANSENLFIENRLHEEYPGEWERRYSGYRIGKRSFLEYDGIFTWPSESEAEEINTGTCHALRQQIAILADGTVVPCCLDSEGKIPLGNIFREELSQILEKPLAKSMLKGFREGKFVHPLCKTCTYARRFN